MIYTPDTELKCNKISAKVKGVFNPGTHINFQRDENEKYYLVKIQDGNIERTITLPEWILNSIFITPDQQAKKDAKDKADLENLIQQALDKQIAEQIKQQEKTYGGYTVAR